MKTALITGVTGQDGSYLADFLLEKGYDVHGTVRRSSVEKFERIAHIRDRITLHQMDLLDQLSIITVLEEVEPWEVYNLAAQSFVPTSWNQPLLTGEFTALGVTRMLEGVRTVNPDIKFYQASSSEMFGMVRHSPQSEETPFYPRSPYGVAKLYAHWMCINYRESYDMFTSCGMLFNHEGPRRGMEFVTQKIARGVAEIYCGVRDHITLGNLDARRDWGYAPDYVEAMWHMLQLDEPDDFVIGTGVDRSVKDFLTAAFDAARIDPVDRLVKQDPRFMRPAEVDYLRADSTKAYIRFGWKPKTSFEAMLIMMVQNQIEAVRKELR